MNYFKSIAHAFKFLANSFNEGYVAPNAHAVIKKELSKVIRDCSEQGKLLILNLTLNGTPVISDIRLDEENFVIYTSPYNAKGTFETARSLPINQLPFCGLFLCPTADISEIVLVDKFATREDLIRADSFFLENRESLLETRTQYVIKHEVREERDDQDYLYHKLEREQIERQEEEERLEQLAKQKEKQIELMIENAKKKFENLPPEPDATDAGVITIRCKLPDGQTKTRRFLPTQKLQLLSDFVQVDIAPNVPVLKYGFPPKLIEDLSKLFQDETFKSKDMVIVESHDPFDE